MTSKKALERIKKLSCAWNIENDDFRDVADILPNACRKIEKDLKVLEILKNKLLSIDMFYLNAQTLTTDEFNLIKEWLTQN